MSLPPGFLDELRNRLTLSAVVGRKVAWDRRKTNPARGDFWACCPFHQEKTPSFHVEDRKGFYHCFGCSASGDAITFVMETENVPFIEAVEMLAREAGLEMPDERHDPKAGARKDRLARLAEAMEEAVRLYGRALRSAAGQPARDYAAQRGLSPEILRRFEIGHAPDARQHQVRHFRDKGLLDEAIAAGLVIRPEDGGAPYDRFRGRLMFPIRDVRGRCVAFGARALAPDAQPKYLNSPETELFSKGRTLYNHGPAREASAKAGTLIVAEGYTDVIALVAAGFEHAVAPLGTAITDEQLALIWRIADEPVIALDGDEAGIKAAERLIDLALPKLAPGKSLRFCLLPPGHDPDDLIRAEGPAGMRRALDAARPLSEMLWLRETSHEPIDTPERRAALDRRLRAAIGRIADASVRAHYDVDIRVRRSELFGTGRAQQTARAGWAGRAERPWPRRDWAGRPPGQGLAPGRPMPETRRSALARPGPADPRGAARLREAGILLIACHNPHALGAIEAELEEMTVSTPEFAAIRDALVAALHEGAEPLAAARARIGADPVELLSRLPQARALPLARPGRPAEKVAELLAEAIARHQAALAFEAEIADAVRELAEADGEDWTWRMRQARLQLQEAARLALAGAGTDEEETVSEIQRMLDDEVYKSKKRRGSLPNQ
ncbi:MAG TPA: DNA primase [Thermohalobaculum sp.]|nr:DNA primase [Thermohalobaculum sp.]